MKKIKTLKEMTDLFTDNDLVVVKFGAEWCGPCRVIEKAIEEIEAENADTALFAEVDVDDADESFVDTYYLRGLPVTYFFKHATPEYVVEGVITKEQLLERVMKLKDEINKELKEHNIL